MKTKTWIMNIAGSTLALLLTGLVSGCAQNKSAHDAASRELCVATYNLRYASPSGPNAWPDRRPLVARVIRTMNPDVLGTQEGVFDQLNDMAADLPEYRWIGTGRDGGNSGEFMAIFYLPSRLQPLSTNHFWLSDTPEVVASTTWGNSIRRMVTWVRFADRLTGREFDFYNTHFDHQVQPAREKSAELVRSRIQAQSANRPVILLGDFNAAAGRNRAYSILTEEGFLRDTWDDAPVRKGEGFGTFNGFRRMPTNGVRIDWILTRGNLTPTFVEIVTLKPDDQWASDHFPVLTRLRFD